MLSIIQPVFFVFTHLVFSSCLSSLHRLVLQCSLVLVCLLCMTSVFCFFLFFWTFAFVSFVLDTLFLWRFLPLLLSVCLLFSCLPCSVTLFAYCESTLKRSLNLDFIDFLSPFLSPGHRHYKAVSHSLQKEWVFVENLKTLLRSSTKKYTFLL